MTEAGVNSCCFCTSDGTFCFWSLSSRAISFVGATALLFPIPCTPSIGVRVSVPVKVACNVEVFGRDTPALLRSHDRCSSRLLRVMDTAVTQLDGRQVKSSSSTHYTWRVAGIWTVQDPSVVVDRRIGYAVPKTRASERVSAGQASRDQSTRLVSVSAVTWLGVERNRSQCLAPKPRFMHNLSSPTLCGGV